MESVVARGEAITVAELLDRLSDETRRQLRDQSQVAEDVNWPAQLALKRGWLAANEEYQRVQRELGRREMQALLAATDLRPPFDAGLVKEIVLAATELYLLTSGFKVAVRAKNDEMTLYVTRCPVYERFEDRTWYGLTACGCFARRRGWYEVLGRHVEEELVMNRKWGDPVCQVIIRVPTPAAAAAA